MRATDETTSPSSKFINVFPILILPPSGSCEEFVLITTPSRDITIISSSSLTIKAPATTPFSSVCSITFVPLPLLPFTAYSSIGVLTAKPLDVTINKYFPADTSRKATSLSSSLSNLKVL